MYFKPFPFLIAFLLGGPLVHSQHYSEYTYPSSAAIFSNPERGFYKYTSRGSAAGSLSKSTLQAYREDGYTLIYRIYYMSDYVDGPIARDYLDRIREDFQAIREAGVKVVLRFAYTSRSTKPYGDATPEQVQEHIAQLKPILQENADVIAVMQAGFIGAWGEWYYTDYFATGSPENITAEDLQERSDLIYALLDALPAERQIQLRYVGYKMDFFGDQPITAAEAYSGTPKSRIAHHNDCFVSSNNDVGTYHSAYDRTYLREDSKYIAVGGETCRWYEYRGNCDTTLLEMTRYHWSFINIDYFGNTIQHWKDDGCFDDIQRKLGYRYNLISGSYQDETKQSGSFHGSIALMNNGFSNPYNPRSIEIILRHKASGDEFYFPVQTDLRLIPLGDTIKIEFEAGIPETAANGDYEVFLNLPDPMLSIKRDPNYSIRLANESVWEDTTGYNKLSHTLNIDPSNDVPDYDGEFFFDKLDEFSHQDTSLDPPPELFVNQYADNAVLYWGLVKDNSLFTVLEKSEDGEGFLSVALLSPDVISHVDRGLMPGNTYYYRSFLSDNYTGTIYSNTVNINPDDTEFLYPVITVDGDLNDWDPIRPILSAFDTATFVTFCFADTGSLNVLILGENINRIQLYLETDANNSTGENSSPWTTQGIDFMVSGDSLFVFNQQWQFSSQIENTYASSSLCELSIPLSDLALQDHRIVKVGVKVFGDNKTIYMPFQGFALTEYERILPPQPPSSFNVKSSDENPESKLIITWESCSDCDGYFLETSVGNMDSFKLLTMLDPGELKYSHAGLDYHTTYYYRIYSYNFAGPSAYTGIGIGYTDSVNIQDYESDTAFQIFPNPADDHLHIKLTESDLEPISIILYDSSGKPVLSVTPETFDGEIIIPVSHLPGGLYMIKLKSVNKEYKQKVVIE